MDNFEIVKKIRKTRIEQGKTQRYIADLLSMAVQTYSDIEHGRNQLKAADLFIIAEVLGKPVEYFYYSDDVANLDD